MGEASVLMAAVFGLGWVVHLASAVGLFVVVGTVVRRHRPDAWRTLFAAALCELVQVAVGVAFNVLTPVVSAAGGIDAVVTLQVGRSLVGSALAAVSTVLLLLGIVRVARPFVEPSPEGSPPYR